ncbi:MAG: 16S rRNA (cytosine(1402)-N(4))-methyltransferase RsmH [Buchnera aphidicola (Tetraneura akinire)]
MNQKKDKKYFHTSVMKKEVIKYLKIKKNGIYIDATFGYGGHTKEILKKLGKNGRVYAIDKDPETTKQAEKIADSRFHFINGNFSKIYNYVVNLGIKKKIDGILFDLGISSPQLDNPSRGFSFSKDGPLDMRMNQKNYVSASRWLKQAKEKKIHIILKKYGEERYSKKIARAIKKQNKKKMITRTNELSKLICDTIPILNKKRKKHPATRSFQAIRIYINQELKNLDIALKNTLDIMNKKSRILIISFHSLEDKQVKKFILNNSTYNNIPTKLSILENDLKKQKKIRLKNIKKILPSKNEIKKNPRSRSAILRVSEII